MSPGLPQLPTRQSPPHWPTPRASREAFAKRPEFAERKRLDDQISKGASKRTDEEQFALLVQRAEVAEKLFALAVRQLPGFPQSMPELTDDSMRYNAAAEKCKSATDYKRAKAIYEQLDSAFGHGYPGDYWRRVDARVSARGGGL